MRRIDRYQVFAELKRGPSTTIFKALDARHKRVVLIKLLQSDANSKPHLRSQFLQESKISRQLAHPNLRRTYDTGMIDNEPYLVLEYVEGPTLFELINKHPKLPLDLCIFIAKEVARAISAVHRNQVLHRDIKPQNIFISYSGEVKLGDLGLAKEFNEANQLMSGTPAYMSPEYVLGRELTVTSDLFSFGAVLYELLTGVVAFINRTLPATLLHVANWDPIPIPRLRPEVPAELIAICQKLLMKNPAERYRSARAVVDDLAKVERLNDLTTTRRHLAEFLESPETYRKVELKSALPSLIGADGELKRPRMQSHHWAITAIVSATMFFAGVLFIKGVKEYVEQNRAAVAKQKVVTSPAYRHPVAGNSGYLDLRVLPWGIVRIDGDSVGSALRSPLALSPGLHEVCVEHPGFDRKMIRVTITAGDTVHQTVDFTRP